MAWLDTLTTNRDLALVIAKVTSLDTKVTGIATQLNRIEAEVKAIQPGGDNSLILSLIATVNAMQAWMEGRRPAKKLSIDTEHVQLLNKQGVLLMSGSVTVTTDHDERIPLIWTDETGVVSAPAAAGTTATSDDAAVISSVDVAGDDMSIVCRTAGVGTCNVTVTNGPMKDTVQVVVVEPTATTVSIDATDATMVPKGTAA